MKTYTCICGLPGPRAENIHRAVNVDAKSERAAAVQAGAENNWLTVKVRRSGPVPPGQLAQFTQYRAHGGKVK